MAWTKYTHDSPLVIGATQFLLDPLRHGAVVNRMVWSARRANGLPLLSPPEPAVCDTNLVKQVSQATWKDG